ncbi:MAG: exodeoxyribonuclease VII large subunit [Acidimicrobiia bacterium]
MGQPSLDLDYGDATDDTWGVADLNAAIAVALRKAFPDEISVRGEIEGLSRSAAGHVFFNLVERGERTAELRVTLFNKTREGVERYLSRHRIRLENGMHVRISGRLEYYEQRAQVSLRMSGIDLEYTLGRMAQDRERVLRMLVAEGLLDRNRSLRLPLVPLRVGLVASRGTAGYADFTDELAKSGFAWHLVVADSRVQGDGAAQNIVAALRALARADVDVVAVIRGGGSRTDLAVFDTESIARAIAAMPVPVITGVGHDIDRSIADEVAHQAFKTPTACAGSLIERVRGYLTRLDNAWVAIANRSHTVVTGHDHALVTIGHRLARATTATLDLRDQRAQHTATRVQREAAVALATSQVRVTQAVTDLRRCVPRQLADAERAVALLDTRVNALDPVRTLARGWTITRTADGAIVHDPASVAPGTGLITTFATGELRSTVDDT